MMNFFSFLLMSLLTFMYFDTCSFASCPNTSACPRGCSFICEFGVIPDAICCVQCCLGLEVIWYNSGVQALRGNELTPTQVQTKPVVKYNGDCRSYHLLIMFDPDAPSRADPTLRSILHWLVGNIPGDDVDAGDVIAQYLAPIPPAGTGPHRYVILVYKQPSKLFFDEPRIKNTSQEGRFNFNVQQFEQKYGLECQQVGANLFLAQYDENVPQIMKNYGF